MGQVYRRQGILFKLLPCLLIAMYAVMCLIGSYVCASSTQILKMPYGDINVTFDESFDTYEYFGIFYSFRPIGDHYDGYYYVFASHSPIYIIKTRYYENGNITTSGSKIYDYTVTSDSVMNVTYLSSNHFEEKLCDNITFSYNENGNFSAGEKFSIYGPGYYEKLGINVENLSSFFSGNFDINDTEGNPVFPGATQEVAISILPQKIISVDFSVVLREVLEILLILLPVVILLISLMKVIQLLFQVLRRA